MLIIEAEVRNMNTFNNWEQDSEFLRNAGYYPRNRNPAIVQIELISGY